MPVPLTQVKCVFNAGHGSRKWHIAIEDDGVTLEAYCGAIAPAQGPKRVMSLVGWPSVGDLCSGCLLNFITMITT